MFTIEHRLALSKSHRGLRTSPTTEFRKGSIPWNKGKRGYRVHSDEYKEALRKTMKASNHLPDARRGSGNYNWKGGARITESGYRMLYVENEIINKRSIFEHRQVAARALGRPLRNGEVVHHVNGDKLDNRNANLVICSPGYHRWLEGRMANLYKAEHFPKRLTA